MKNLVSSAVMAAALGACAHGGGMHEMHGGSEGHGAAAGTHQMAPSPSLGKEVTAPVVNAQGARIGSANFREGPMGVVIRLEFNPKALTPGWHGAHLHMKGDCSDFAAGFQASGPHVGHTEAGGRHGLLNPAGPEEGDLANIFVADTDGPFATELFAHGARLGAVPHPHHNAALLGPEGAALVIHANADDHKTQPIGGAGARVACAAIRP